jgi:hypothetical protein
MGKLLHLLALGVGRWALGVGRSALGVEPWAFSVRPKKEPHIDI